MPDFMRTGEFFSVACAFMWAIAMILFRQSGRTIPPVALNLFKDVVGLLLFLITLLLLGVPFFPDGVSPADWAVLLVSGMLGIGVADTLLFASLNRLGAGSTAIINCVYSPFVLIAASIYLDEPVGPLLLLAMALMAGAILLQAELNEQRGSGGAASPEHRRQTRLGLTYGLLAVAVMAVAIVMVKPVLVRVDIWWATTVRLLGGVALLLPQGLLAANRDAVKSCFTPNRTWRYSLPSAFVGAYVAMIFWLMGMQQTHTSVAAVLSELSTLFVILLAALFLREPLNRRKLAAVGLGFVGSLLVML